MNEVNYPPEMCDVADSALEPGETFIEMCSFKVADSQYPVITIITNRYFHLMDFGAKRRRGFILRGHSRIRLASISAVTTQQQGKRLSISFFWEGNRELLLSRPKRHDEARVFVDQLKRTLTIQEIQKDTASVADEIEKLSQLANEGILSAEELSRAKEMFLGQPVRAHDN